MCFLHIRCGGRGNTISMEANTCSGRRGNNSSMEYNTNKCVLFLW